MTEFFSRQRRAAGLTAFVVGAMLTVAACGVLVSHTRLFSQKRDTAVMIGTTLPELKSEVALLAANTEAEQLFIESALESREELADAYMLPVTSPGPRLADVTNELARALSDQTKSPVNVAKIAFDQPEDKGSYKATPAHLTLKGSFQSVARFLGILGFSGDMMVKDVLSADTQADFLTRTERAAPLSLKEAEDFLYLDLLSYAAEPDIRESRLFKDMSTDAIAEIRALLLQNGLAEVRTAFGGVAAELKEAKAWPMPLTRIDGVERNGEMWTVSVTVFGR